MIHELKIKPEYFAAVVSGDKTFEIRNNTDRNFQVGDTLLLMEWVWEDEDDAGTFTGNFVEKVVSYITDFEQKPGYVVLGLANKREQELAEQLADATRQCVVMAELLREVRKYVTALGKPECEISKVQMVVAQIDAIIAGQVQVQHPDDVAVDNFAKEMKEKLAKSRAKGRSGWDDPAACSVEHLADLLLDHIGKGNPGTFEDIANFAMMLHQRGADPALLIGKLPASAVTVTETILTAPAHIWLQVGDKTGDSDYPFPEFHDEVSWCADSVVACEVPYVRADLAAAIPAPVVPEGWKLVPLEPEGEQWGGLARAIIFWMRSYQSNEHTPATLEDFITRLGNTIPDWMKKESEFGDKGHVISKGTAAAFIYKAMLADAPKPPIVKLARFITEGQELELTTVLQSIVNGFSDDPAHDAAALLKRITGEVPWTGDSFQLPSRQGGESCAIASPSSSPA